MSAPLLYSTLRAITALVNARGELADARTIYAGPQNLRDLLAGIDADVESLIEMMQKEERRWHPSSS